MKGGSTELPYTKKTGRVEIDLLIFVLFISTLNVIFLD